MASLNTCQVCSPAEDLQTSQGRYHLARRARKKKTAVEAAHLLSKHPGAVGRSGDNNSEARETTP